jgi:hypothetical protein
MATNTGQLLVGIMVGSHRNSSRAEKISMCGSRGIAGETLYGRQGQ